MNISLTPQLETLIAQKVKSGLYHSASEVVRAALRLLEERDQVQAAKLEALRQDIAVAHEQSEHGQATPFDEQAAAEIKARGRQRLATQRKQTV